MERAAIPEQPRAAPADPLAGAAAAIPLRAEGVTWRGDDRIVRELLAERLPATEVSISDSRTTVVKSGPHRAVYRVGLPSGTVFLKHFKIPDWRALVRNVLRRSPAEREAAAAAHVAAAGIETTVSAALGVTRRGLFVRDSFLVTHEIRNARPLDAGSSRTTFHSATILACRAVQAVSAATWPVRSGGFRAGSIGTVSRMATSIRLTSSFRSFPTARSGCR